MQNGGTMQVLKPRGVLLLSQRWSRGMVRGLMVVVCAVMSEYHKMDTNEYPNIFGCHIMYQMIGIYSDATYFPN